MFLLPFVVMGIDRLQELGQLRGHTPLKNSACSGRRQSGFLGFIKCSRPLFQDEAVDRIVAYPRNSPVLVASLHRPSRESER